MVITSSTWFQLVIRKSTKLHCTPEQLWGAGRKRAGRGGVLLNLLLTGFFHSSVSLLFRKKKIKSDPELHPFAPKSWNRWWSSLTWPSTCPQTKTNKLICHTNCLRFIKKQNCISRCWQLRPSLHGRRGIHWVAFVCWEDQAGGSHYEPGVWAARWHRR